MNDTGQILARHRVLIVVPTYNNAGTIGGVIAGLREIADDILVVDDGSTDGTLSEIVAAGAQHITYAKNRGKGYAIRRSFAYAVERGYDYVLTVDADGQHYPSDIAPFAQELTHAPDSLIIGARNLRADNMPSQNTFANRFSNFWYFVETGRRLDDTQSGFRLYPMRKIGRMRFLTRRYEFEVEVIVRAAWKGTEVRNIPVNVYYPPPGERVSHFKPIKDFARISLLNSVLVIAALLYHYPRRFIRSLTRENAARFVRNHITHTPDSNHKVAASIGLGVFFGIVPIWGYQMIAAGVCAHFLRLNKVLAVLSSNISMPPTIPFILYGSVAAGAALLGREAGILSAPLTLAGVYEDLFTYIYGAVALAIVCGAAAYMISIASLLLFRRGKNG